VHVEDVLGGEVAGVVGQGGLNAEPLEKLDVGEAVGEAGRIAAEGDLGPGDLVGAVEGEEGGEADAVGEVGEVLELTELGQAAVVAVLCLLILELNPTRKKKDIR
jgi:hypothetical protein